MRFPAEFGRLPRVQGEQVLGGRYKLLNELGSGGMAVVWRARDEVLGRPVAVKFLDGRYAHDPYSRSKIRDEARAAAALSPHPHIAQVYDFGESQAGGVPVPYVVMELVNGTTLQQRLTAGHLEARTVFRICGEVASALAAAHADGLVHRDIKPANVMVTAAGAKVVDFGLAAAAGEGEREEVVLGTPAYLAPERLTHDVVEPASDVYALGVLLYRLLAGKSPWSVDSTTQMLSAHVYIEPAPLSALPGVPPEIIDLVNRCLRKDPADRPTAAEVSAMLAAAAAAAGRLPSPGTDLVPVRRPDLVLDERPTGRRRRTLLLAAGFAVILAAAALIWLTYPGRGERAENTARMMMPGGVPASSTATGPDPGTSRSGASDAAGPVGGSPPEATAADAGAPELRLASPAAGTVPTTPAGSPSSSAPTATPTGPHTKTLTSPGGSVVARCGPLGRATLLSWTPTPPYTVVRINSGPAYLVYVVFATSTSRIRMNVTCEAGQPVAAVVYL